MKLQVFALTLLINSVMSVFIAATIYFVGVLFRVTPDPSEAVLAGMGVMLFVVYPAIFSLVRGRNR